MNYKCKAFILNDFIKLLDSLFVREFHVVNQDYCYEIEFNSPLSLDEIRDLEMEKTIATTVALKEDYTGIQPVPIEFLSSRLVELGREDMIEPLNTVSEAIKSGSSGVNETLLFSKIIQIACEI